MELRQTLWKMIILSVPFIYKEFGTSIFIRSDLILGIFCKPTCTSRQEPKHIRSIYALLPQLLSNVIFIKQS